MEKTIEIPVCGLGFSCKARDPRHFERNFHVPKRIMKQWNVFKNPTFPAPKEEGNKG